MRKEKLLAILVFFALVVEPKGFYNGRMWTPMQLLGWFLDPQPQKIHPFGMCCLALLLFGAKKSSYRPAQPLVRALLTSFLAVVFFIVYGLLRDGWSKAIFTQVGNWLFALLFAWTAIKVWSSVEDFHRATRAIAYAALYRSVMAITLT